MKDMESEMDKLIENGANTEFVAKVVLDAIMDIKPNIRYLAGNDVEQILGFKNKLSDEDFHNMLKQM